MKVSVITPTYQQRESNLKNLYTCFQSQTHPEKELLVLDDSPQPSEFFQALSDPNVTYIYFDRRLSTGEKRNLLVQQATGEIIAHFDDDDYYAPNYLERSLAVLNDGDFITLSGWYAYAQNEQSLFYWDTTKVGKCHFKVAPREELEVIYTDGISPEEEAEWVEPTLWGFGFSYMYRKRIFETLKFNDVHFGEDYQFVQQIIYSGHQAAYWPDQEGLVLHIIHQKNISLIYPQYLLPTFLLVPIFGQAIKQYIRAD